VAANEELKLLSGRLAKAEAALASIPVRQLEVYEHAPLLEKALIESKERLLIISPWIRAKVVNRSFVRRLEGLLRNGVLVYIGYGLGEEEDRANPSDLRAEEDLAKLADRYENFKFIRLGDTHAKVLICDREFWVNTSFNWLSFMAADGADGGGVVGEDGVLAVGGRVAGRRSGRAG
jgi:phosphatidylserine/phosphatidylglycerophosphate/cardiolipin synthase-like enzyme